MKMDSKHLASCFGPHETMELWNTYLVRDQLKCFTWGLQYIMGYNIL